MSYSNPKQITYTFASHDFGAGAGAHAIKAPVGVSEGIVIDVGLLDITETFTNVTTGARVQLGLAGTLTAFAELDCGAAAATDCYNTQDDTNAITQPKVPNSQLEVTFIAPTGGTPAGIARAFIVIAWK